MTKNKVLIKAKELLPDFDFSIREDARFKDSIFIEVKRDGFILFRIYDNDTNEEVILDNLVGSVITRWSNK